VVESTGKRTDHARAPVLVVGVGSELRSDDAAGRRVAEAVATELPVEQVEVCSVHQLTPELADAMTDRRCVVIVDASVEVDGLVVASVTGDVGAGAMSHHLGVPGLVRIAEQLGRGPGQVVTVAVPAHDLGMGTELSPATAAAARDAVARVLRLCRDLRRADEAVMPWPVPARSGTVEEPRTEEP
jgi:hydrogenase maturation protease